MNKQHAAFSLSRMSSLLQVTVYALLLTLPMFLTNRASAATVANRYIDMSSILSSSPGTPSNGSGRDGGDTAGQNVTYTVGFDMPATGNVDAIVVEFCSNSPIALDSCTAPTGLNVNTGTAVANQNGISSFTKIASIVPAANRFGIENGTPQSITSNTADTTTVDGRTVYASDVKFDITGITNPTSNGTFYARVYVYADNTNLPSTSWVSTTTNSTNGTGAYVHDGGLALAVANELTVTARVQEVLEFCIGTDTSSTGITNAPGDDCGDVAGTSLSLGVVDSNSIQRTSDGDILNDGVAMVRTNAIRGAAIFYKAEQNTSSGKLKIAGQACSGTNLDDPCFNSAGGTQAAISAGTESFGMTLRDRNTTSGGATNSLSCDANYDGDGSCSTGAATGYAWTDTGAFDTIASSTGPIDDEKASIEFAATAAPTTPTGLYTVTANFVATSTF